MTRLAFLAALLVAGCGAPSDDDDDTGTDHSALERNRELCIAAHQQLVDDGCTTSDTDCDALTALYARAGCTELDIEWYQCLLDDVGGVCAPGCDYNPSLDCLIAYCMDHLDDEPECPRPPPPMP